MLKQYSDGHEIRFAYALWGISWIIIGIYDETLAEDWCTKYFVSLLTLAVFSIWTGYEMAFVKILSVRATLLYFSMYVVGINNWNVSFMFLAILHRGWDPWKQNMIWLAPNVYVPSWFYILMTIGGFIIWLGFGILINIKKNVIPVRMKQYTY